MLQMKATLIPMTVLRGSVGPWTPWLPGGWDQTTRSSLRTYIQDRIVEEQSQGRYEIVVALLLHL